MSLTEYRVGDKAIWNQGRIYERERIIKLLEDPVVMSNWWSQVDKNLGLYGNLKNYVIALIKGGNNE